MAKQFLILLLVPFVVLTQACSTTPGGGTINTPSGVGPFPVVIVLHTSGGLTNFEKRFAQRLANHGYVSVAPSWWGSQTEAITDTYDYLIAQPNVDPSRVGLVGFSRGGRAALWFASRQGVMDSQQPIAGVISYYGGNSLVPWINSVKHPPTLFLYGDKDEHVEPIEVINYCEEQLKSNSICQYHFYKGVRHAFTHRTFYGGYDREAAADAWERTLEFLEKHVKRATP